MRDWNLLATILISIAMVGVVLAFPETPFRTVLGLIFILFLPGYSFISFLFPEREIEDLERLALSFGLSIAIVPADRTYFKLHTLRHTHPSA